MACGSAGIPDRMSAGIKTSYKNLDFLAGLCKNK
jgi:hypothetical protein